MHTLTAPLRVTWQIPADPVAAGETLQKLAEGRVLFIEAQIDDASSRALCAALAGTIPPGMRISALGGVSALRRLAEGLPAETLSRIDAFCLFSDGVSFEILNNFRSFAAAFFTTPDDLSNFSAIWKDCCADASVNVALLNPHAPAPTLTPGDRAGVAAVGADPRRVTVHDLFLAEEMGCDPFAKYAGCAAGETLAHLTAEGVLVACRTLPVVLGDLRGATLKEIWAGKARSAFRDSMKIPDVCRPCALCAVCKGGCPGLAGPDGRDASCPGARSSEALG